MQSIKTTRSMTNRIWIAVAAIGALILALTGTGMLFDDSDDGGTSAKPVVQANTQRISTADMQRFIEANTNLPGDTERPADKGISGDEPVEQNMTPPGTLRPAVRSAEETRFLEMNTIMPGMVTPTVVSYEQMRFLEMNLLPVGDDSTYLPSPNRPGLTDY